MIKLILISLIFLMGGCTVHLKSDTKQNDQDISIEKEFYIGPKVGQH